MWQVFRKFVHSRCMVNTIYLLMTKTAFPLLFFHQHSGRIRCNRCQAHSKRTRQQCQAPAMHGKTKCRFHGGKSTGPKTLAGRESIALCKTIHGRETRAIRKERSASSLQIALLEDLMYLLKMTTAPRTRGRKPLGYWEP
jgi:hypothetical protein